MKNKFGKSRGQIAVLYAGAIATLLGAVALGADVAVMYMNWQQMQKVADAAAIAGANYLTGLAFSGTAASGCGSQLDDAKKVACTYAVDNGLAAANLTLTEPTSSTIKVVATETGLPYYFAKTLGLSTYTVSASAMAAASAPVNTVTSGLFPLGIQCNSPCDLSNLNPGQSVSLGQKLSASSGNWGWLDFGSGIPGVADAIPSGATGSFSVGSSVGTKQGNAGNSGPVKTAFAARMSSCPTPATDPCSDNGNPKDIPAGDPCLVTVAAVDFGASNITAEGFAEVYIEPTSTSKSITACFVQAVAGNTIAGSGAPSLGAVMPPTLSQ